MFYHNLYYSLKVLFKNKGLLFWTFIFPIILGTLFKMAFSNIENKETLSIIDIGIVNSSYYSNNVLFKSTFDSLSDKDNKDRLFNIVYTNKEEASKLLENGDISGYIDITSEDVIVYVKENGINESILKYTVDQIKEYSKVYSNFINNGVDPSILSNKVKTKINNISSNNLSYTNIEFYTLLAMTSLYGGLISMFICNKHQANISPVGKRTSTSCISKTSLILSNLIASYIVEVIGLFIVLMYTLFVLNVSFGSDLTLVILVTLVGALSGLSIGVFISTFKVSENDKTGILIGSTMIMSFFSGMYGITMKYVIDKNIPIINKLNPTSLITDAYYSIYYYNTYSRYITNIVLLLIISIVLIIISVNTLRRSKYECI